MLKFLFYFFFGHTNQTFCNFYYLLNTHTRVEWCFSCLYCLNVAFISCCESRYQQMNNWQLIILALFNIKLRFYVTTAVALQLQVHSLAEPSKPAWISGSTREVGQILFLWGSLSVLEWIWDWCWSDGLDLCASITSAPFFTHTHTRTHTHSFKAV